MAEAPGRHREQALTVLADAYGAARADAWLANWLVLFLAFSELWGTRSGREWLVW
jgi:hypothetical protein